MSMDIAILPTIYLIIHEAVKGLPMPIQERHDNVCPREWIDFEHELRRRHLSSDDFLLSTGEPVVVAGAARVTRDSIVVRHRLSNTVRQYDCATWQTDLIRDVNAGAF